MLQCVQKILNIYFAHEIELVSKELNHFGVIADLFQQIGGYGSTGCGVFKQGIQN